MARGRMIKQSFVTSDKLNSVSRDARLLYACLLPFLDREGRSVAEPTTLKVTHLRPTDFTADEIAALLVELESVGLIWLYADDQYEAILEYRDFLKHNSPNKRENDSVFPKANSKKAGELRDALLLAHLPQLVSETSRTESVKQSVKVHELSPSDDAVKFHAGREGKVNSYYSDGGARAERAPPQALQAYLDRDNHPTSAADELEELKARWSQPKEPLPS